ncbi:DivIVA domain-containing protein [Dyadobacter psychrotolerans]|uniref:DivIVA domain-containing protein n=1 Tax=Dyadobacter psychrotolerans TaxID=2541721 RepID=A0A4R5DSJ4_9BACT|nr:DivIVA domain-containing protein [Dyadobacter psychrotolerans]TDE16707.1 DivIVA domain-containing protein [Dyadobacter psychrotolerans]
MKISAIDIRKHTFEKIFRGYDPDEVDAFLNSLSQEWERFSSENGLLKMQLEYAEKELGKLKDIESTLFRTLKSAEDVSRQIEKEANENAEKRIEESKIAANELVAEAEKRTAQVISETEAKLKRFKEEFAAEIKIQERDFKAIENFRDNLVVQLASLANSTIDTVDRFEQKYDKESVLNKMEEIRQHVSEIEIPRKYVAQQEITEQEEEPEEVNIILSDEKPEVVFEVAREDETVEAPQPEEEIIEQPAAAEEVAQPAAEVKEPVKSAADAANEALAEMHKTAEKARDEASAPPVNRPRVYESNQPSKGGGGSFFDQI